MSSEPIKTFALECVATYLNVNYGYNQEIMSQCRKLYEYAYLIEAIRKHLKQGYRLEKAVEYAIDHCIENDILTDFLRRRRAEVTMNLLTEYDEELHIRCEKELSFQEGKEIGIQEGIEIGIQEGKEIGIQEGIEKGIEKGLAEGLKNGLQDGMKAMAEVLLDIGMDKKGILERLMQKFSVDQEQAECIIKMLGLKDA